MTERDTRWSKLFQSALLGDRNAYAEFLREATPVIRRIIRARGVSGGGANEVEDTVQEVLLAIHAKRHTWRTDQPVTPWLYAIARYKAVDGWRRRGRPVVRIEDLADVLVSEPAADASAARDVRALLAGLDDRSAGIVRSVAIDGDSAGEVGARLGMSEGAVRVALHRAMTRLKGQVGMGDGSRE